MYRPYEVMVREAACDAGLSAGLGEALERWDNRIGLPPRGDAKPDFLEPSLEKLADLFPRT